MSAVSVEGSVLKIETQFECVTCTCGLVFAVPSDVRLRWRESGASFHCPMGHSLSYTDSEAAKLRKELAAEKKRKEWAEQEAKNARAAADSEGERRKQAEHRLSAAKGAMTRLKKRVQHGVCPCCHRTVKQLAAHMKTKHPSWSAEATP